VAKATIKSSTGAVITVEGTEAEVSNILSAFEKTAAIGQAKETVKKLQTSKQEAKRKLATSDLVIHLKENGFFEKAKSLGDITSALEEQGHLVPVTSLSGVVLGLVQKRVLRRKKMDGKWMYGK
jgi:septation ring formation regulator EzrA